MRFFAASARPSPLRTGRAALAAESRGPPPGCSHARVYWGTGICGVKRSGRGGLPRRDEVEIATHDLVVLPVGPVLGLHLAEGPTGYVKRSPEGRT